MPWVGDIPYVSIAELLRMPWCDGLEEVIRHGDNIHFFLRVFLEYFRGPCSSASLLCEDFLTSLRARAVGRWGARSCIASFLACWIQYNRTNSAHDLALLAHWLAPHSVLFREVFNSLDWWQMPRSPPPPLPVSWADFDE